MVSECMMSVGRCADDRDGVSSQQDAWGRIGSDGGTGVHGLHIFRWHPIMLYLLSIYIYIYTVYIDYVTYGFYYDK